jgi:hypothetical protein
MANNPSQKATKLEKRIFHLKKILDDLKKAERLQLDVTISFQGSGNNVITQDELSVLIQAYDNELCRLSQELCFT